VPGATSSRRPSAGRPPLIRRSAAAAIADRRTRSARVRRRRRQVILWLLLAVVVGVAAFGSGLVAAPLDYRFQPQAPRSVLLLDSAGHPFATIRSPQVEDPVLGSQIPLVMRRAIVAAEDQRFYSDSGIDPLAILRAAWRDVTGAGLQGGSTITQQYVKNVYTGSEQTPLRKLREASLAIRLEQHLTKDQILTRYLNTLYLGNGTAGVQAASEFYFGVPISKLGYDKQAGHNSSSLGLARAATLAGIAPAPSVWNPVNDPKQARARELYVLNRMVVSGYISALEAGRAFGDALPRIAAHREPEAQTIAPEFRDLVAQQIQHYGDSTLFASGGMQVKTTLDLDMQQAATHALAQVLPKQHGLDAAIVAVDPRNGDLRAITERKVGGYVENGEDLADPPHRDITRSSGSTIKPFTLAAALEHGHTLTEGHYAPECIRVAPGYRPCNAEGGAGFYSLESALEHSINTVYAPLAVHVGMNRVVQLARQSGMEIGHLDRGRTCGAHKRVVCPSYALGIPVSPLSEANAFGTIVDNGVHHPVRSVLSVRLPSQVLFKATGSPTGSRVMPANIADEVTNAMQEVVDGGTGTAARQPFPVYGKTGTTDHFTDAWFTGCTHSICITVWMGYDKPHQLKDSAGAPVYGGTVPARIFAQTFSDYRILQTPGAVLPTTTTSAPVTTPTTPARPTTSTHTKPTKSSSATPSPAQPSTAPPTSFRPTSSPNPSNSNGH
jgi:penicillin-binding protein 1A